MRNIIKWFGTIALVAIIGFSMTACGDLFNFGDDDPPDTPTGVTAVAASSSSITVSWTAVEGATSYIVYRSTNAYGTYTQTETSATSSYTDIGLAALTTYYYKVSASNSNGESAQSAAVSATTSSSSTVPGTPTGVTAARTTASSTTVRVSWIAVSGATSYRVYYSATDSGNGTLEGSPTTTTYSSSGKSTTADHYFRVSAVNSAGEGSPSSWVKAGDPLPDLTGKPEIEGIGTVGQTLTVNTSKMNGTGTYSYQWKRGTSFLDDTGTAISGATSSSYTLVTDDVGKYVSVTVSCTSHFGSQFRILTSSIVASAPSSWVATKNHPFPMNPDTYLNTVAYGNGKWIAGGQVGSSRGVMASSTDGITWTEITGLPFSNDLMNSFQCVAYGDNNTWVAGNWNGRIATSIDNGVTWTEATGHGFESGFFATTPIFGVAYGNNRWVAVGRKSKMAYSDDGVTWTPVADSPFPEDDSGSGYAIESVAYGNNRWVAVGEGGDMATSTDNGVTWTKIASPFDGSIIEKVTYANNMWVAVSYSSEIATSTNGTTWAIVQTFPFLTSSIYQLNSVAYGNNRWVAVGRGIATTTNANTATWTPVGTSSFGGNPSIYDVAYGDGKFVAVGYGGVIAYSPTGL